ncbi:MAG: hypothetical protein EOP35_01700 [Rubrivivax sp.]|nr:MAG: hypothetical protein EOP35_01700 [Rubrivivax sp.]
MRLHDYLNSGAMTSEELAEKIGLDNDGQIRQWRHNYGGRVPGAANAVAIEEATGKAVRRWDLRPKDWHLIWPELKKAKGAPAIPVPEQAEAGQAG